MMPIILKRVSFAVALLAALTALWLSVGVSPPISNAATSPLSPAAPYDSLLALFDEVGLYQKNGLIEIYGADLRQRQSGPIAVSRTELHLKESAAFLHWSPDFSPASGATHLYLRFAGGKPPGHVTVGLTLADGTAHLFSTQPSSRMELPKQVPAELAAPLKAPGSRSVLSDEGAGFVTRLPPALVTALATPAGNKAIRGFFVLVEGRSTTSIGFESIALVKTSARPEAGSTTRLSGTTSPGTLPGTTITLLTQHGMRLEQVVSADGSFAFERVPSGIPVSIRLKKDARDYYSTLGRWFVVRSNRTDIHVSSAPTYVNADGHPADPSKAKFVVPTKPLPHGAFYEPHTRQFWPGISKPQEFESTTFSNNAGYIDRDRFPDNPDGCIRIVHLGSSNAVALQVRPFEKYNVVMESELAVTLQRCVEVISAGRDNGDIGSNYLRIRDYALAFKPSAILLENSASLMMQMTPLLLSKTIGWDHANNALDNFFFDTQGRLQFRRGVADYGVYAVKPDRSDLAPGIPLHLTLQVPMEYMPAAGKEAFRYLGAIMTYLKSNHPDQKFVLHSALDEVTQCKTQCEIPLLLPGGKQITAGSTKLIENMRSLCSAQNFACFFPSGAEAYRTTERNLTFQQDAHYSVLGHQWLAEQFNQYLVKTGVVTAKQPHR